MYVCICKGVTSGNIRSAIIQGARSPEDIERRCRGAGADCGSCRDAICELIEEHDHEERGAGRCQLLQLAGALG